MYKKFSILLQTVKLSLVSFSIIRKRFSHCRFQCFKFVIQLPHVSLNKFSLTQCFKTWQCYFFFHLRNKYIFSFYLDRLFQFIPQRSLREFCCYCCTFNCFPADEKCFEAGWLMKCPFVCTSLKERPCLVHVVGRRPVRFRKRIRVCARQPSLANTHPNFPPLLHYISVYLLSSLFALYAIAFSLSLYAIRSLNKASIHSTNSR